MNRAELQNLAEERIKDAKILLDGGRWEFAYYAAGYAVECGLKSCILTRMVYTGWVFEEKWDAKQCRDHDFSKLIILADLNNELNTELQASATGGGEFAVNWNVVKDWNVTSRYAAKTEVDAKKLSSTRVGIRQKFGALPWSRAARV